MIIDDREHDIIINLKKNNKIPYDVRRLDLGDFLFERNGSCIIVERKRSSDFASSICDGRWREQKKRLMDSGAFIIYIIEGSLDGQRVDKKTLISAILNTVIRDRVFVLNTSNLTETIDYLIHIDKKNGVDIAVGSSCISLLSKRKRKFNNSFQLMLMALPGISERIASALSTKYSCIVSLQKILKEDPKSLHSLHVTDRRKIGAKTTKTLQKYLLDCV